jgi:hypothetical protein
MVTTGWIGGEPDAAGLALPVTNLMLGMRQRGPGGVLENALARSRAAEAREAREEAAFAPDPDERAAGLVARGYAPGLVSQLAQRLADTMAEIEAENAKIEAGERRAEHAERMRAAGLGALEAFRMLDGDFGDPATVERLSKRATGLRRQIAEVQAMIAPQQQREMDPVEAASRHAHQVFKEVTRAQLAEVQERERSRPRELPPFGSVSRGVGDGHFDVPECRECVAAGATAEESLLIHNDPQPLPVPDTLPATHCRGCGALLDWCVCAGVAGRYQPVRAGG